MTNVPLEDSVTVSVVMPCLDEEKTVGLCVDVARAFLASEKLAGEILVVDNGSTDDSAKVAREHGALVVLEPQKGYGRALRKGLSMARGKVIVLGDCDMTYDFRQIKDLLAPLLDGSKDVVIGNRFAGRMEPGAMSLLHRVGVPFLSAIGRLRYDVEVQDFHCGLRALTKEAAEKMELRTEGMEFSTEMIAEAARKGLRIGQVAVSLHPCRFERASKLRTFRDGFRHLRYMVMG